MPETPQSLKQYVGIVTMSLTERTFYIELKESSLLTASEVLDAVVKLAQNKAQEHIAQRTQADAIHL